MSGCCCILSPLAVTDCWSVSEEGLYHLRRFKQLLSLDLSFLRSVSDAVLDELHGLKLEELHLAEDCNSRASFTDNGLSRSVTGGGVT